MVIQVPFALNSFIIDYFKINLFKRIKDKNIKITILERNKDEEF
jgi:hypothetical protein